MPGVKIFILLDLEVEKAGMGILAFFIK